MSQKYTHFIQLGLCFLGSCPDSHPRPASRWLDGEYYNSLFCAFVDLFVCFQWWDPTQELAWASPSTVSLSSILSPQSSLKGPLKNYWCWKFYSIVYFIILVFKIVSLKLSVAYSLVLWSLQGSCSSSGMSPTHKRGCLVFSVCLVGFDFGFLFIKG